VLLDILAVNEFVAQVLCNAIYSLWSYMIKFCSIVFVLVDYSSERNDTRQSLVVMDTEWLKPVIIPDPSLAGRRL
jgi:hypothetical protein